MRERSLSHTPPRARLGLLYPCHAAEDDYPLMGSMIEPPAQITLIHTEFLEDAHTVEALSEMGSVSRLSKGAEALAGSGIESVMWTSTSASFVLGLDGIRQQIDTLEKLLGVPASTTAMAVGLLAHVPPSVRPISSAVRCRLKYVGAAAVARAA